ncbi:threonine-phosphate decarboxylase [Sphingomonas sp. dw_22]|uniref:threonine-phosphate decarboxylase n=1 Tax=Sphingomonas sp. dw_22 TaxID=2721175 RepID=UPI001BD48674|nr:threonine-phosphate decarboxylase [Sphingomonas sp. dw_22]
MTFTFHGGRLSEARSAYAEASRPWLDLSTGINPHAWPGIADIDIDWRALPDERALIALETAAATYFGTHAANVCAVPGTEIGLRLVGSMIEGPSVHVGPGYRTHTAMLPGARAIRTEELPEIRDASILLANPNNPDGHVTSSSLLDAHLDRLKGTPHWLIVDEAFADTQPAISIADRIDDARPLILFRSFGKFFGLAGVRLGFVLGPQALIERVHARLGSWPVSSAALAIGTAAYRDRAWIEAMRDRLRAEAEALNRVLLRHGLQPQGDCPLFRLIQAPDAPALFDHLARQAILTRPFDQDSHRLRIGLPGSDEALARLDRALAYG